MLKDMKHLLNFLSKKSNYVLLYDNRNDGEHSNSYLFIDPIEVINCFEGKYLKDCFAKLETYLDGGYYAAGFLSYEAGIFFEDILNKTISVKNDFPLFWFGIYQKPIVYEVLKIKDDFQQRGSGYKISKGRFNTGMEEHSKNINKIKKYIQQGQTYQTNYTIKYKFLLQGLVNNFFGDLCRKQHVHYAALVDTRSHKIISLSPELFFKRKENKAILKPMKGTLDRGFNLRDDSYKSEALKSSFKDRAENIMIVDLIRNDIGRVSVGGGVKTQSIFDVEKFDTLFQMTSTVSANLKENISWFELFKNILPSGSVTGAPKIRTMQIISSMEKEPRNIYTGGIGFMSPKKTGVFNVAIRTILFDKKSSRAEMGIGSGVVWDSDAKKEYEECKLKSKFLTDKYNDFQLIETMCWQYVDGFPLLDYHLSRLEQSAAYFGFLFDKKEIIKKLDKKASSFDRRQKYRIRLLLYQGGKIKIESRILSGLNGHNLIAFSNRRTDSSDRFLFHKTTQRKLYNEEYARCSRKGYFDVIFSNEKNEITEGAISNIFIEKNGIFYTPPLACGVLGGTYRSFLIKTKKFPVVEKILYKNDIINADRVYLTNALRGMVEAKVVNKSK